jgi:uncharacterized tellurite resistance protein B-like protein
MEDLEHILRCCLYTLVADLITADGTIENAEVGVAGNLCEQFWPDLASKLKVPDEGSLKLSTSESALFADKSNFDIRDYCREQQNSLDATTIIGILSKILDGGGKLLLMDLLHEVARADSNIAREESTLLTKIGEGLGRA